MLLTNPENQERQRAQGEQPLDGAGPDTGNRKRTDEERTDKTHLLQPELATAAAATPR